MHEWSRLGGGLWDVTAGCRSPAETAFRLRPRRLLPRQSGLAPQHRRSPAAPHGTNLDLQRTHWPGAAVLSVRVQVCSPRRMCCAGACSPTQRPHGTRCSPPAPRKTVARTVHGWCCASDGGVAPHVPVALLRVSSGTCALLRDAHCSLSAPASRRALTGVASSSGSPAS